MLCKGLENYSQADKSWEVKPKGPFTLSDSESENFLAYVLTFFWWFFDLFRFHYRYRSV